MAGALIGIVVLAVLVVGPLLWRVRQDRRQERAQMVQADVRATLFRALAGESLIAVAVQPPGFRRPGRVVLTAPADWQRLLDAHWRAVAARVPADYELVLRPVAPGLAAPLAEHVALGRAA
jgi:hypothetical protein